MTVFFLHILAISVYATAGAALFFILYNRSLLPMKDRVVKRIVVPAAFASLMLSSIVSGALLGCSVWLLLPAGFLALVAVGETHRLMLRHRYRGSPPVEDTCIPSSLLRPLTTTDLAVRRYELRLPHWKGPRIRIAHISDLHANTRMPLSYYEHVMDTATAAAPDLVFITGDFVSHARYLQLIARLLPRLRAERGVYAVLGNHDFWTAADGIAPVLAESGVIWLGNGYETLRFGEAELTVAGCEVPWCEDAWFPAPNRSDAPTVVLTHTADNVYELDRAGADVIFAGHYHGGQVNLPGIGALACPSRFGRRFNHGHYAVGNTHLFVTAGIGSHFPPARIYCPPEILIVDLLSDMQSPGDAHCHMSADC